jgi:hypothetical protein
MSEKKLTEAEIMKALELCGKRSNGCADCPYFGIGGHDKLNRDILDLINRKNAENERLSVVAHLGNLRADGYRVMRDRALKAEAEIETARAEAIKEFIATLKAKKGLESFCGYRIFDWELDQIAKEMGVEL